MRDHDKAHAHGKAAGVEAASVAHAPGKDTQHEHHAHASTGGRHHGHGSVFDAFKAPHGDEDAEDKDDLEGDSATAGASSASGEHDHKLPENAKGNKAKKSDGNEIHIITRAGLRHLREAGREGRRAARTLYNNENAYIVCKDGQTPPKGWKCKWAILFPSYADFEAAHQQGRIPKGVDAVVYDNEHWAQTPREEKTHAIKYARKFGELAHKLGMVYIAAPTQKWFNADARFADIIDLQLQGREVHTRAYAAAIRKAVKFADKHNPDMKIIAQISSNKNHLDPDHSGNIDDGIEKAERDILENLDMIDGFWGYLYQQNGKSIRAGQRILKDLARKREKGVKV